MASGFKWYPQARRGVASDVARALSETAAAVVADVEERQVVPHAEAATKPGHVAGMLASSVSVDATRAQQGAVRIVWDAPFAARAYFHPEWEFSQAVHGSARGRWMDDYMEGGARADFAPRAYAKALRRGRWFR